MKNNDPETEEVLSSISLREKLREQQPAGQKYCAKCNSPNYPNCGCWPATASEPMTPESQRIAIAVADKWNDVHYDKRGHCVGWKDGCDYFGVPDYLNDLNAMHEAEKGLPYDQHPFFANHLTDILRKDGIGPLIFDMVHTTAAQRAEAFLRTLGLWK